MKTKYYVYSGLSGWEDGNDLLLLYPDDLPSDWRLAFYSTQFRCVYLPFEKWVNASDEEVASWLNDTHEGFQFVLESPEHTSPIHHQLASRFGSRGILDKHIKLYWLQASPDFRQLSWIIQSAVKTGQPVYLISREGNLALLRQIDELMVVLGV